MIGKVSFVVRPGAGRPGRHLKDPDHRPRQGARESISHRHFTGPARNADQRVKSGCEPAEVRAFDPCRLNQSSAPVCIRPGQGQPFAVLIRPFEGDPGCEAAGVGRSTAEAARRSIPRHPRRDHDEVDEALCGGKTRKPHDQFRRDRRENVLKVHPHQHPAASHVPNQRCRPFAHGRFPPTPRLPTSAVTRTPRRLPGKVIHDVNGAPPIFDEPGKARRRIPAPIRSRSVECPRHRARRL